MMIKRLLFIFFILSAIFLTGCWSSKEINTLAISICVGIDKTENGYLITEQILNPKVIASETAPNEPPVVLYTAEGIELEETIRRLTTQSPRIIYNSHLRMVVLGEDVAKDGLQKILDYFARGYQYRTDFYFIIARNATAYEVLHVLTPLESIPGIYMYNSLKTASEEWAPTKAVRIIELVNDIIADGTNPVLTGIEIGKGIAKSAAPQIQSDNTCKLIYSGLGVFKKDTLAGWLDEEESKGYNFIAGNVKETTGHAFYGDNVIISFENTGTKSVIKASMIDGRPVIDVEIKINNNVGAVQGNFDVSKIENTTILNKIAEEKVKSICERAVNKLQKEFKTDIFGFGEAIHRKYPKLWEKMKDDWNEKFADLTVNITVEAKLKHVGQISKSFFIKED